MTLQTVTPTTPRVARFRTIDRVVRKSLPVQKLDPARMQVVEDRLIYEAMRNHHAADRSLDRALDELTTLSDEVRRSRRVPLMLQSSTELGRVEDLLLEAILRTHPNRDTALARILDAVVEDDAQAIELRERIEFDTRIDNDFDGMS